MALQATVLPCSFGADGHAQVLLSLSTLNRAFVDAGAPNDQHYTTLGQTMLAQYHWLVDAGLLLAFSVGGLLYYLVFYRSVRTRDCSGKLDPPD